MGALFPVTYTQAYPLILGITILIAPDFVSEVGIGIAEVVQFLLSVDQLFLTRFVQV